MDRPWRTDSFGSEIADLTPFHFILWGHIDLNDLKARITQAFSVIPEEHCKNAVKNFHRRIQKCIEIQGDH